MRKAVTPILLALLFAGSSILLPAACSGKADDADTLILNNNTEPQTLDPGIQKGQPEHHINISLFEGLTVYDARDLSPKPGVATSWEISPDGTVYTFRLREAKWSSGDPVTAHDFEWSWKRVLDPNLGSEYVEQISIYLKNAKAYYQGASADGTLRDWSALPATDKAKGSRQLEPQVQKRHAEALRKLAEAETDPAVAANLRKAAASAAGRADVALDQVGVKAQDDRILVVTLEAPTPYFLDLTAFFTYYPVNRKAVEKHGKDWTKPENHVGNGPYRMKEWKVKEYILVEKNPHYWDAANVPGSKVKYLPIENLTTAFNLYEKGKIHWLTTVPGEYIEELMKRPDYHTGPFLTTYFYGFNTTRGPLKDKRVRKALALAIDKEKVVKHVTRAGETAAGSLVPPGLPGYTPALMPAHDPAAARKLLAEAGYPDGKGFPKVELLYNTLEAHKRIAAAVQEMWRTVLKIDIELRNVEWKVYLDMQSKLEFDVIRRAWIGDYNDPNTFLDMFTTHNGNNNTGFSNAAFDKLIADAVYERDAAKRMRMLHEAEAMLMEEMPIVPIYFYVTKNLWKPGVEGVHDNVRDTHPLQRVRLSGQVP